MTADAIPKEVKIGGRIIKIVIKYDLEAWGEYHGDSKEIHLSHRALAKRSTFIETLRHEMLHAALDICGLTYLKNYEEESIVRCIDNVFFPAWDKTRKRIESQ